MASFAREWQPQRVLEWIKEEAELPELEEIFMFAGVNGQTLLNLNNEVLLEIGVVNGEQRDKLLAAIDRLKGSNGPTSRNESPSREAPSSSPSSSLVCDSHGKPKTHFCLVDEVMICGDCTKKHASHGYEVPSADLLSRTRGEINDLLEKVALQVSQANLVSSEADNASSLNDEIEDKLVAQVEERMADLRSMIDELESILVNKVRKVQLQKRTEMGKLMREADSFVDASQEALSSLKELLGFDGVEFLSRFKEVKDNAGKIARAEVGLDGQRAVGLAIDDSVLRRAPVLLHGFITVQPDSGPVVAKVIPSLQHAERAKTRTLEKLNRMAEEKERRRSKEDVAPSKKEETLSKNTSPVDKRPSVDTISMTSDVSQVSHDLHGQGDKKKKKGFFSRFREPKEKEKDKDSDKGRKDSKESRDSKGSSHLEASSFPPPPPHHAPPPPTVPQVTSADRARMLKQQMEQEQRRSSTDNATHDSHSPDNHESASQRRREAEERHRQEMERAEHVKGQEEEARQRQLQHMQEQQQRRQQQEQEEELQRKKRQEQEQTQPHLPPPPPPSTSSPAPPQDEQAAKRAEYIKAHPKEAGEPKKCKQCGGTFTLASNTASSCQFHKGPLYGPGCMNCKQMHAKSPGCVSDYHSE